MPPIYYKILSSVIFLFVVLPGMRAQIDAEYDPCREAIPQMECTQDSIRLCNAYSHFACDQGFCFTGYTVNGGIPQSQVVSGKHIEIDSTYVITKSVLFENCVFAMAPGSSIFVSPEISATVEFRNCEFFSDQCERLWQGIAINRYGAPLTFLFTGSHIEDAYIALQLAEGSNFTYYVRGNRFANNHIGISNIVRNYWPLTLYSSLNTFIATAPLLPNYASGSLPAYPDAYAGIELANTQLVPNQPNQTNPVQMHTDTFRCLENGIILNDCIASVLNSVFLNMDAYSGIGIHTTDGTVFVRKCRFGLAGLYAIEARGTNLTASGNDFSGLWYVGIQSSGNLNQETVRILNNSFHLNDSTWYNAIQLFRSEVPAPFAGTHNVISGNVIEVDSNCATLFCIQVVDAPANDTLSITQNTITVRGHKSSFYGIFVTRGQGTSGQAIQINHNELTFPGGPNASLTGSFGITVLGPGDGFTQNHEIMNNSFTGAELQPDIFTMTCGVHFSANDNFNFCHNEADFSYNGFHFANGNLIAFRENHMTRHRQGVLISNPPAAIGPQYGRGNTWSADTSDFLFAILMNQGILPILSEYVVSETNPPTGRTFFPPINRVFPIPDSLSNWYRFDSLTVQDHCTPTNNDNGGFSERDRQFIEGELAGLSGAETWDMQRRLYARILADTSLAPPGSDAAAFFSSLAGSSAAAYAQLQFDLASAGTATSADANALVAFGDTIQRTIEEIDTLDASIDLSNPGNLNSTYLSSRAILMTRLQNQHAALGALRDTLAVARASNLLSLRIVNAGLTAAQPWQVARQQLNDLIIGRMLGETLTSTSYAIIVALSNQSPDSAATVPAEAAFWLASCHWQELEHDFVGSRPEPSSQMPLNARHAVTDISVIYPNPSTGLVHIDAGENVSIARISVWNQHGLLIWSDRVASSQKVSTISLANKPSGIYRIALIDHSGKIVHTANISILH